MNGSTSAWVWLLQRITGVLLVILLGIHFWLLHFARFGAVIAFQGVHLRLSSLLFFFIDFALLVAGLYHGLNGVRNVMFDYDIRESWKRGLTWALWIVGLAAFGFGLRTLLTFLVGQPIS